MRCAPATEVARKIRPFLPCTFLILGLECLDTFHKAGLVNKATYPCVTAYRCALLETDPTRLSERIDAAREAINARLRRQVQIQGHEHRAIAVARKGLSDLQAERIEK